jgi:hypothetical protein
MHGALATLIFIVALSGPGSAFSCSDVGAVSCERSQTNGGDAQPDHDKSSTRTVHAAIDELRALLHAARDAEAALRSGIDKHSALLKHVLEDDSGLQDLHKAAGVVGAEASSRGGPMTLLTQPMSALQAPFTSAGWLLHAGWHQEAQLAQHQSRTVSGKQAAWAQGFRLLGAMQAEGQVSCLGRTVFSHICSCLNTNMPGPGDGGACHAPVKGGWPGDVRRCG